MVRLGYALVFLGFGYGLVCLVWSVVRRWPVGQPSDRVEPRRHPAGVVTAGVVRVGAVVVAGSLFCPWLTGPAVDGGRVEGSGWELLDPFSTVTLALLVIALVVGAGRGGGAIAGCAASAGALVIGNALVQGGSAVVGLRWGAWVGVAGALVLWAGAALVLRPPAVVASGASRR